jgi:RNA polymerase sigma factor (TIGR02999 family)
MLPSCSINLKLDVLAFLVSIFQPVIVLLFLRAPFWLLSHHRACRFYLVSFLRGGTTPQDLSMNARGENITELLISWRAGDSAALDILVPLIQQELMQIARRHLGRERKDQTMQPSSLVQEAFLRLLPERHVEWQNRAHFFALASRVMRHLLVDHARRRSRAIHGGDAVHIPIEVALALSPDLVEEVVAVDLALQRLETLDQRKSRVLEMRLFGGLSVEETAEALGVAPNTVTRDWNFARAWLRHELGGEGRR